MKILVINAGSSSLKYQLIDMQNEKVLAKGIAERIGSEDSVLKHTVAGKDRVEFKKVMKSHIDAVKIVLNVLVDAKYGVIKSMSEINAVGHRVLHGGEKFTASVIVNDEVKQAIQDNAELGPLHNPANLMGINACENVMPSVPQVAVFDTAFHQTMPREAYLYALPYDAYKRLRIRRYGFHGTSHRYVSKRAADFLKKPITDLKMITCHLGNGSSIAAVKYGKCIDTSMGLTPLEGLVMGTRCGDIDPAIVPYIMKKDNLTPDEMDTYMNKKSGVLGISGLSSDFRDLEDAAAKGHEGAKLALDMFVYRIKKYIGSYAAAMDGVDVIVFTGGIGENTKIIRKAVCDNMSYLGIKLDSEKNNIKGIESEINAADSKVKVVVIPTNEELMIARDTLELVTNENK